MIENKDDINYILESITEKTKRLIQDNKDLRLRISQLEVEKTEAINNLENKIKFLNNQISENKEKQQRDKEILQELLQEIEDFYTIYSENNKEE